MVAAGRSRTRRSGADPGVTFIVGQNGSGKSTLVEGIAVAAGFNPEGGTTNFGFATARTRRRRSPTCSRSCAAR